MDIPQKMKAAVLHALNDVRVEECDVPVPGSGEVLVRIAACGICGSDIKMITHGMPDQPPMGDFILGHEYAGTIVALGEAVDEFSVGDRIAVEVHKGCGRCRNCILGNYTACLNFGNQGKGHRANGVTSNGGFAEYAVNHVNTLARLPDHISFDEATMVTTAGSSIYALDMVGGFIAGDTIVVLGAGPIGLMALQCAKALGAETVILADILKERLVLGRQLGADHVINAETENSVKKVLALTNGLGADLVLDAAGSENTLQQAIEMVRKGGKILIAAFYKKPVTADISMAVSKGVNLYTIRGEGRMNVRRAMSLMGQGKITGKPLITHTFPLEDIKEALASYAERRDGAIKVVVHPQPA